MNKRLLVVVFVIQSIIGLSQLEKQKTSLIFAYQYARVESFPSLQLNGEVYKNITFESSLGVGLRTTIIQGRLFPQFSVGVGYDLLKKKSENFCLSPMISTRFSGYQLSPLTRLNYTEVMPGYSLTWGNHVRIVQSTFFGKGWEWNENSGVKMPFWTFSINLGIGYVF